MAVFRAESSDLSHMGVYTGMSVISVWALLRANTVYWRDASHNTLDYCIGGMHITIHKTKVLEGCISQFNLNYANT